jgi:hypothetical protein
MEKLNVGCEFNSYEEFCIAKAAYQAASKSILVTYSSTKLKGDGPIVERIIYHS